MSDTRGGIHCADGIDPADAHRHKRETGSLNGLAGCQAVTNEELLTLPCDILIPRLSRISSGATTRATSRRG